MIVEVFSMTAAISGTPYGTTWRGDLDLDRNLSPEANLEVVFRAFNRVDQNDHERMAELGYLLPSLSVGDYVTLHLDGTGPQGPITEPRTWHCRSMGFEEITGNRDLMMRSAFA